LFIRPHVIANTQNVLQLNQRTLDMFRHGRWQHL